MIKKKKQVFVLSRDTREWQTKKGQTTESLESHLSRVSFTRAELSRYQKYLHEAAFI